MFKNTSLSNFQESILRTSSIAIITNIIKMYVLKSDDDYFSRKWVYLTIGKIIGFGFYDLFLYKIPKESKFKNQEKSAYEDVLYFGSMLFFKEIALSHYQNREFDSSVLKDILTITILFTIYNLYIKKHLEKIFKRDLNKNSDLLSFTLKIIFGIVIGDFLPINRRENIPKFLVIDIIIFLISLPIYFLGVKPMFSKKLNIE